MARSVYGREKPDVTFNLTPMIDVTFQLIIFFILAGSFASLDLIRMNVPELFAEDLIKDLEVPGKVVVNLPGYPETKIDDDESLKGKIRYWKVGTKQWGPKKLGRSRELLAFLKKKKKKFEAANEGKDFEVYLRAEDTVNSGEVMHVLGIIKEAGFTKIYYVAATEQAGG